MKVAVVHNRDSTGVINVFGMQNRERYNPRTVERVASALESGGHNVRVIDGNMHVIEQLHDFMPRVMAGERPGMVFNMAYGIQGVSRYTHLPAMLEMLGVPYVGSGPQAHGLALDKVIAKMIFQSSGISTPGFWNFATADQTHDDLVFPVIVKPKMEAVSYGIQVVDNWDDLRAAVGSIIDEFGQHVLVEQFIPGREFAVGLLGNGPPEVLPIVEIDLDGDPNAIQTAGDKLKKPKDKICPARLDDEQSAELGDLARRSFESLGLHDFARIDVRMDAAGRFHVLEINSMASLGLTGTYVHAAQTAGYGYDALINRMLDVAAVRYFGETHLADSVAESGPVTASSIATKVRSYLRTNQTTSEDQLRQIVNLRTPATNGERVDALGDWATNQLRSLRFDCVRHPAPDVGSSLVATNHSGDRHDIMILGHLDTAPGSHHRFRAEGSRLYGSGIAEHKGGLVVLVSALRALRFARSLRGSKLAVVLVGDDTLGGRQSASLIEQVAASSDLVVGLKAGDLDGGVLTSRAGRATYTVELAATGKAEPSPADAAPALCRRVVAAQRHFDGADARFAVTDLSFAARFDEPPDRASLAITVRFPDAATSATIDDEVARLFARAPRGYRFEISGGVRRPPLPAGPSTDAFYERVAATAEQLHVKVVPAHRWHSAGICHVGAGTAALDGLGPLGTGERTADERILRSSLVDRAALLAMVIHDAAHRARPAASRSSSAG